ncbi:MAG: BON domain-containing protein [Candidatus Dadabacteria bacterium]|nr:MAG: BON domain-containing protein [Candidatus Dadabacteria bacterium]
MKRKIVLLLIFIATFFSAASSIAEFETIRQRKIKEALQGIDERIGPYEVTIIDRMGYITLEGRVGSDAARKEIAEIARAIPGVERVTNDIKIDPEFAARLPLKEREVIPARESDRVLRERLIKALRDVDGLSLDGVSVQVKAGRAVFGGSLPDHRAVDKLLSAALMVDGIEDIESNIYIGGKKYKATE